MSNQSFLQIESITFEEAGLPPEVAARFATPIKSLYYREPSTMRLFRCAFIAQTLRTPLGTLEALRQAAPTFLKPSLETLAEKFDVAGCLCAPSVKKLVNVPYKDLDLYNDPEAWEAAKEKYDVPPYLYAIFAFVLVAPKGADAPPGEPLYEQPMYDRDWVALLHAAGVNGAVSEGSVGGPEVVFP